MIELSPFKIKDKTILTAPNHPIDAELGPEAREVRRQLALDPDCYICHPSVVLARIYVIIPIVFLICLIEYKHFTGLDPALHIMIESEISRLILRMIGFFVLMFIICYLVLDTISWFLRSHFSDKTKASPVKKQQVNLAVKNSLSIMGFNILDQKRIATYLFQKNGYDCFATPSNVLAGQRTFCILRDIPGIDTNVIEQYEKYLEDECLKATGYKSLEEKEKEDRIEYEKQEEENRRIQEKIAEKARIERERIEAQKRAERESRIDEVHQHFMSYGVPVTREQSAAIADTFGTGGLIYSDLQTLTRGSAHLPVEVARAAIASYNQTPMSGATKALGDKGEADVKYRLDWFIKENPGSFLIAKDCTSKYSDSCILLSAGPGEEPQEFDFLLLGRFGLFSIEVKNYSAETIRVESDTTWILEGATGNRIIESPVDQVLRHEDVLLDIVGRFPLLSMIVLANSNQTVIGGEQSSIPIVNIRDLKTFLLEYDDSVSDSDVIAVRDLIEQHKVRN